MLVSIIIPVYNVEPYLEQCLSSVAAQSFSDWECIVVDDGSTDGSGAICDLWAKRDSRFRIVHQENAGVSAARNRGLELAQGKWINFIDSDDWVDTDYLKVMVDAASEDTQLIVSGLKCHYTDGTTKSFIPSTMGTFRIDNRSADSFTDLTRQFLIYGPCCKLFDCQIVCSMDHRFPVHTSLGEDLEFNINYLHDINYITCVSCDAYHYRKVSGHLSSLFREDQFDTDIHQWRMIKDLYLSKNIWNRTAQELLYRRLWEIIHDGLFRCRKFQILSQTYIRHILTTPEIDELRAFRNLYDCAKWIKILILNRCYRLFYGLLILYR